MVDLSLSDALHRDAPIARQWLYFALKRWFDVTLAVFALPILLPVLVLCVVAIRLDSPGQALYTQLRTGQHGRRFRMWKFRTMVVNAEELKASLAHLNILPPPDFKIPDDPRITRVGRLLRRTSVDELPQLINVLLGDMSLVGPRPTSFAANTYDLWHTKRLEIRPGLTGLWQVRGRNLTTFDERLRLDIQYIENMSFSSDLRIILATLVSVVKRAGA